MKKTTIARRPAACALAGGAVLALAAVTVPAAAAPAPTADVRDLTYVDEQVVQTVPAELALDGVTMTAPIQIGRYITDRSGDEVLAWAKSPLQTPQRDTQTPYGNGRTITDGAELGADDGTLAMLNLLLRSQEGIGRSNLNAVAAYNLQFWTVTAPADLARISLVADPTVVGADAIINALDETNSANLRANVESQWALNTTGGTIQEQYEAIRTSEDEGMQQAYREAFEIVDSTATVTATLGEWAPSDNHFTAADLSITVGDWITGGGARAIVTLTNGAFDDGTTERVIPLNDAAGTPAVLEAGDVHPVWNDDTRDGQYEVTAAVRLQEPTQAANAIAAHTSAAGDVLYSQATGPSLFDTQSASTAVAGVTLPDPNQVQPAAVEGPTLAETGVDASQLGWGIGAFALIALGALVAFRKRIGWAVVDRARPATGTRRSSANAAGSDQA